MAQYSYIPAGTTSIPAGTTSVAAGTTSDPTGTTSVPYGHAFGRGWNSASDSGHAAGRRTRQVGEAGSQAAALPGAAMAQAFSAYEEAPARREPAAPDAQMPVADGAVSHEPAACVRDICLNGDLPVGAGSLQAARILALKSLYSPQAKSLSDAEALEQARRIHLDAEVADSTPGVDQARVLRQRSLFLQLFEAQVWMCANGLAGSSQDAAIADLHREVWSLASAPVRLPRFRSRDEIARTTGDGDSAVKQAYFAQFTDFIDHDLDRLCRQLAVQYAEASGIGVLGAIDVPPEVWPVKSIEYGELALPHRGDLPFCSYANPQPRQSIGPLFVFRRSNGLFGLIDSVGRLISLPSDVLDNDGKLRGQVILRACGVMPEKLAPHGGDCGYSESLRPMRYAHVALEPLPDGLRNPSILEMLRFRLRAVMIDMVEGVKNGKFNASLREKIAYLVLPFYKTLDRSRFDAHHKVSLSDVLLDVAMCAMLMAPPGAIIGRSRSFVKTMHRAAPERSASQLTRTGTLGSSPLRRDGSVSSYTGSREEIMSLLRSGFPGHQSLPLRWRLFADHVRTCLTLNFRRDLLRDVYASLCRTEAVGAGVLPEQIAQYIDASASRPVPKMLYRAHTVGSADSAALDIAREVRPADLDDYLAAIIRHVARTSGSYEEPNVLSLTADRDVAARFARGRANSRVMEIETGNGQGEFWPIEYILKHKGPELVEDGRIRVGTLASAIRQAYIQREAEYFFVPGELADDVQL
jgi:hypothetical protein